MRRILYPGFHLNRIGLGGACKLRISGYTPKKNEVSVMLELDEWELVELVRVARDKLRLLRQDRRQQDKTNCEMFVEGS